VDANLLKRFDSEQTKREIDEELSFHLEMLTQENLQERMSLAEAKDAALKQFGDVERIKDQCAEISLRRSPLLRALKSLTILIFLFGVLLRVFSPEFHLTRVGDILMAVGFLTRLLLYVRGLKPSSFPAKHETASPLRLIDKSQTAITAYDQRKRTPIERVIFDK
jgi:hypothetical protein